MLDGSAAAGGQPHDAMGQRMVLVRLADAIVLFLDSGDFAAYTECCLPKDVSPYKRPAIYDESVLCPLISFISS